MTPFTQSHFPQLHFPPDVSLELLGTPAPSAQLYLVRSRILCNDEIAPEHFRMRLRSPEVATGQPGQFVMIRPAPDTDLHPLLPRPMAVYRYLPQSGEFEIVYRVVGEGTHVMAERRPGEEAEVVGPAGRAFVLSPATTGILLVGRGIGICSITSLAEQAARQGVRVYGLLSGRNPQVVIGTDLFAELGADYRAVNDAQGTSDPQRVRPWFQELMRQRQVQQAYVCGANRLIALTSAIAAQYAVEVQVSLEAHMACGFGYCHGCATGAFGQRDESPLVCRDGPVFRCSANGRDDRA